MIIINFQFLFQFSAKFGCVSMSKPMSNESSHIIQLEKKNRIKFDGCYQFLFIEFLIVKYHIVIIYIINTFCLLPDRRLGDTIGEAGTASGSNLAISSSKSSMLSTTNSNSLGSGTCKKI